MVQGDAKLHPNGLISYVSGIRSDGAPVSVARAWGAGGSERNGVPNSDDEEAELDQLLTEAMETDVDGKGRETDKSPLPDSFCHVSTCEGARMPVPTSLQGRHITATLKVGDLLYLPASWFHEVISYGGDAGGHLALNLWMAPPRVNSPLERPYEDGFWEDLYCSLERARGAKTDKDSDAPAREAATPRPNKPARKRAVGGAPWTHRNCLPRPRRKSVKTQAGKRRKKRRTASDYVSADCCCAWDESKAESFTIDKSREG